MIENRETKSNIIDYELVNEILNSEREKSKKFLVNAVEIEKGRVRS